MATNPNYDFPVFETSVQHDKYYLSGYLRVVERYNKSDIIVEERQHDTTPTSTEYEHSGEDVIDLTVGVDDVQETVDAAADAWLTWARTTL